MSQGFMKKNKIKIKRVAGVSCLFFEEKYQNPRLHVQGITFFNWKNTKTLTGKRYFTL